jgi:hypothetical protein
MTLKELETQLLSLTPEEKAQAIQILIQTLTNKPLGITKTPVSVAVMPVLLELAFQFGD